MSIMGSRRKNDLSVKSGQVSYTITVTLYVTLKIALQPFSAHFLSWKLVVSSIDTWIPIQIPNMQFSQLLSPVVA